MKKQILWISILLILLLLAACGAEPEVAEPTEFRVACFGCKELFVSGQLNADFGLCQDCMMRVGAAYCQECETPCYTRDMVHGRCQTCSASIEGTTATPETTVAVDTVSCNLCGRPIDRSESKDGYCNSCYAQNQYHEDEKNFATCDNCGVTYGYTDPLIGGVCEDCWAGFAGLCDTCGKPYRDGDGFESLCYSCQDKYGPKCSVCGTDLTYQGGVDGMCYACYDAANSCKKCGTDLTYQNYDGYCYYCHPSFSYICVRCKHQIPEHRPADGLCSSCRSGNPIRCNVCYEYIENPENTNAMCDACNLNYRYCNICSVPVHRDEIRDGYCYYCHPDFFWYCVKCGGENSDYGPADKICDACRE